MNDFSTSHPEQSLKIRDALEALLKTGETQAGIARGAGLSGSVVSQYLAGTYPGNIDKVEAKLATFIDSRQQRNQSTLPRGPEFVETPTATRITTALAYAQMAGDIAVVYGGAGLGKTRTIRRYGVDNPNVWIATMTPATAQPVTALEEVCEAVGLRDAGGGAARMQRAVIKKVRETGGLLIIDEAQHLSTGALETLRSLHDATGIGLALCGNEQIYHRLTGTQRAASFAQLFSRIGKRVRLMLPKDGDVDALLEAWDVTGAEERKLALQIAKTPGALRGLDKALRLASTIAAAGKQTLAAIHLRAAWRDLAGD